MQRAITAYLDHLTVERGLSRNTLTSYRRDLERYAQALAAEGIDDLAAVSSGRVTAHLAGLRADGLSASTAARAISAVRGLHKFAAREGLVAADVAAEVRPPAPAKRLPKALDVDQVTRLLDVPADSALGLRDKALLEFLYGTGARISEAVGAAVDDLELGDEPAAVLHGKGGRTRLVPIGGFAKSALEAYLVRGRPGLASNGTGTPAVFLNARGGRLSRQSAWAILRRAAEAAGLPVEGPHAVSPHTLRHSYATHLLDGGADVRVVQELLGHASVTTTQVYTLVTVDRLREVYATAHPRAR
ncbi:site-specific tyrosine recombinase XerD [Paractinoplanes brasiliensis]|uniref:Tyrosine recombinase XerD n=1 Tax=Paractinoplanes brasiliensis TaxID=52695 RepID=A0A4R6JY65_9ACTN|nr:site-specific tyrosine recombinase XerD [Actinoplanes brasiliensis]TDO41764.1 integrase/recombinase XerD [Actinoplanes brasiliensis]GID29969.1 tyrosine recombinase XerD [Actinoplanes brasiliensis]